MNLLVTGGSGYVGASILKRAPQDWQLAATYLAHPIEQANVAAFCVDVRDANAVNRLFDTFRPDVAIHTAAVMNGDQMMSVNADGSRNVARAATQFNTRLIHISSDVIFDGAHAPYDESASPAPLTPYAESKARAEEFVRAEYSNPIIVRTSLVYGFAPMDPRTRQTLDGKFSPLFTDEFRCPIFVDDLADALIELALSLRAGRSNLHSPREIACFDYRSAPQPLRAPRNDKSNSDAFSVLNIAGPQRLSRYEFGVKLAKAFHVEPRFQSALCASFPTPRPHDCTLDISRAQKILKTILRSVDEVLKQN